MLPLGRHGLHSLVWAQTPGPFQPRRWLSPGLPQAGGPLFQAQDRHPAYQKLAGSQALWLEPKNHSRFIENVLAYGPGFSLEVSRRHFYLGTSQNSLLGRRGACDVEGSAASGVLPPGLTAALDLSLKRTQNWTPSSGRDLAVCFLSVARAHQVRSPPEVHPELCSLKVVVNTCGAPVWVIPPPPAVTPALTRRKFIFR